MPTAPSQAAIAQQPAPRTHFPWGVCIGQLTGTAQPGATGPPLALLPTAAGGLLLHFGASQQAAANRLLETAALSLVDALPHRALQVHVLDFAIRKRFARLAELAPLRLYRVHDRPDAARKALDATEALARFRHHELLNADTPTLDAYHLGSRQIERYQLLLVNLDDHPQDARDLDQCIKLFDAAFEAGIYVLAYQQTAAEPVAEAGGQSAATASNKPLPPGQQLARHLAQRYPVATLDGSQAQAELQLQGNCAASQALVALLASRGQAIAPPQLDLAAVVAHRLAQAGQAEGQLLDFLSIPVGHSPDGRHELSFSLGPRSDCYHAFIVGMSGSGKTTLLNNLIVAIAERFSSDELRLYLMDYKEGVEFQEFAQHPNCAQIFLDNRDLGAAQLLLQGFVQAIDERGQRFRQAQVKGLDGWNALASAQRPTQWHTLPRLLLIVDEAQRLFTEDKAGREINALLKDVVKRGRAFGVHIVLATQTLINANVDRDLMSQIALRIAYKLNNDTDCDRIFGYGNSAPKNLERFQFIYNADSGHHDANQRVQGLPPPQVAQRLAAARAARPAALCLTPELMRSDGEPAQPTAASPPGSGAAAAAAPARPVAPLDTERLARQQAQQALLAQFLVRQAGGEFAPSAPPLASPPAVDPAQPEDPVT